METNVHRFDKNSLEFASAAWNSYLVCDMKALVKVQERASIIPLKMSNLLYDKRLKDRVLTTLEKRRKRSDLIQMFKVLNNSAKIDWVTTRPKYAHPSKIEE